MEGEFVMRRPKRLRRSDIDKPHCAKPDIDNLIKSTQDAIVDAGILRDDCVVWSVNFTKRYANEEEAPHTKIRIIVEDIHHLDNMNHD